MKIARITLIAAALLLPVVALAQTAPATTPTAPTTQTRQAKTSSTTALPAGTIFHINSAPVSDLLKLPGVNAKIAAEIVKNRPYKNEKELVKKVKGIGTHNVKKILPFIDFQ